MMNDKADDVINIFATLDSIEYDDISNYQDLLGFTFNLDYF